MPTNEAAELSRLPDGVIIRRHMGDTIVFQWNADDGDPLVMAYITTDEAVALARELLRRARGE